MVYDVLEVCRHIINYSNEKNYGISNLKLQKILYFVQAYFLLESDGKSPCFAEKIEAWDFGPVVPVAYHEFKQYGSGDIPKIEFCYFMDDPSDIWSFEKTEYKDNVISKNDKEKIDKLVDRFSDYSAASLVYLTHQQAPWKSAYVQHQNIEITKESIWEYFSCE